MQECSGIPFPGVVDFELSLNTAEMCAERRDWKKKSSSDGLCFVVMGCYGVITPLSGKSSIWYNGTSYQCDFISDRKNPKSEKRFGMATFRMCVVYLAERNVFLRRVHRHILGMD